MGPVPLPQASSSSARTPCREANAYYDETTGELHFGYYPADEASTGNTLPGGFVFTCLSHDIIAHEVTHALLDGLRAEFSRPSGIDVVAFHEAFADLVAVFQRFSYKEVVLNAIRNARGDITKAEYLTALALQFGHTTGHKAALRSALDVDVETEAPRQLYDETLSRTNWARCSWGRCSRHSPRSTGGRPSATCAWPPAARGCCRQASCPTICRSVLADRVAKLARQFLSICIRAIDYCPPVGLTFGDYLRALITADHDLVPDDPWDYRGALVEAFRCATSTLAASTICPRRRCYGARPASYCIVVAILKFRFALQICHIQTFR